MKLDMSWLSENQVDQANRTEAAIKAVVAIAYPDKLIGGAGLLGAALDMLEQANLTQPQIEHIVSVWFDQHKDIEAQARRLMIHEVKP